MNKTMFSTWYSKAYYECYGFDPKPYDEDNVEALLEEYYTSYYKPLAYIASGLDVSYKKFTKDLDNDEEAINAKCKISLNEVISYFSSLSCGVTWIHVLPKFVTQYIIQKDQSIKDAVKKCWDNFTKYNPIRIAWFGITEDGEFGKDVFTTSSKAVLYYEQGETYQGGTLLKRFETLPFLSYDEQLIKFVSHVATVYPRLKSFLPTATVEQIVETESHVVDNVPIYALGSNGFPPVEALQLYEVIPHSEKTLYKSMALVLNHHMSIGAHMPKVVQDWLKSDEVLRYLNKHYNMETPEDVKQVKLPVSVVLPPRRVKSEVKAELKKEESTEEPTPAITPAPVSSVETDAELERLRDELSLLKDDLKLRDAKLEKLNNELQKCKTDLQKSHDAIRYDQELYDSDPFYRIGVYTLYLIRKTYHDGIDVGHNLNAVTLHSTLNRILFPHDNSSVSDLYDYLKLDAHEALSTAEDVRVKILEYIEECEM